MKTPRLSVLLPCRNVAAFLHPCIASLEAQTFGDFEVIAVDDASTDDTYDILAHWAQRDSRVRVLQTAATGLVLALNAALEAARAPLIARMDGDDVAYPQRFEQQVRAFDADPELAACGTQVRYFPPEVVKEGALRYEAWLNSLIEPASIERDMFVECPIAHPTLMIRAAELRVAGAYQDHGWPEDYDLILRLFARHARMRNVPQVLLDWREGPDRLSRSDPRYSETAFRRCKVFYFAATLLGDRSAVILCGAGPVGKAFAREFIRQGIAVRAFVDVDPRKIGQSIYGVPVLSQAELPDRRADAFVIAAVSGTGPREELRATVRAQGLSEGTDFIAFA